MRSLTFGWASSAIFSLALLTLVGSLGCGGDTSPANTAPSATGVSIVDDDGGLALVGDDLTGSYTYVDADGDAEGTTGFRWLRNGAPITAATGTSYTLVAADVPTRISFEVTPVAVEGEAVGAATASAAFPTGTPPVLAGAASFRDTNESADIDAGDELVLTFDQVVTVGAAGASPSDFVLPVPGDVLATQSITAGPAPNQITLELADAAQFKVRQVFATGGTPATNDASGIGVSATPAADFIEGASGLDAVASTPVDIVPGHVASATAFGSTGSRALAVGDLDFDGDLDLAMATYGNAVSVGNQIWLNIGAGALWSNGQSLGSDTSQNVALGGIDGDGDLDLAFANIGANTLWRNNGAAVFTDTGESLEDLASYDVQLGDFQMDGKLDMVVANLRAGSQPTTANYVY